MIAYEEWIQTLTQTDRDVFQKMLQQYAIVDIGTIQSIRHTADGIFLDAVGNCMINNETPLIYQNVELVELGNGNISLTIEPDKGGLVLLFTPLTPLKSVVTQVTGTANVYSKVSMKAIHIASPVSPLARLCLTKEGNILFSNLYSWLSINADGSLAYQQEDIFQWRKNAEGGMYANIIKGRFEFEIDENGVRTESIMGADDKLLYWSIVDDNNDIIERRWAIDAMSDDDKKDPAAFVKYLLEIKHMSDGTIVTTRKDADDKVLFEDTEGADGAMKIVRTDPDGKVLLEYKRETDGNLSISLNDGNTTLTVDPDGAMTIDTADKYVFSSKGVESTSTSGKQKIGNDQGTIGALGADLVDILVGLITIGAPGSHTLDGGTITKLNQFKADWQKVFE